MLDSLVRVSRRVAGDHYASILAEARSSVGGESWRHCASGYNTPRREPHSRGLSTAAPTDAGPTPGRVHSPEGLLINPGRVWSRALPFQQFHVLFNSLFKVLFIFRSLYLFAIGLPPVFSFRWNLPPILSCIPKQLDSSKTPHMGGDSRPCTGFSPSTTPCSKGLRPEPHPRMPLQITTRTPRRRQLSNLSSCRFTRRYWGNPCWFLFLRLLICLSSAGIPT